MMSTSGRRTVQQSAKHFSEQLNRCLDDMGVPTGARDRAVILGKMLHIPKQQAWGLLEGHFYPDSTLLQHIATEFEVDTIFFESK
jgi:hypothetical protein